MSFRYQNRFGARSLGQLDNSSADADEVFEVEIAKRLDDVQSGKAQTINADEALRRIDARLRVR